MFMHPMPTGFSRKASQCIVTISWAVRPPTPNFGKNLDDIAGRSANRELAMALERTPTPNPLESASKEGEAIAGSFVKFLIERHGMDKFRALYALTPLARMQRDPGGPTRWQQVYGESFEVIVDAWLTI